MQQAALAGASVFTAGLATASGIKNEKINPAGKKINAADKPFNMNYAIHDGMFKNNGGNDFIDQIKYAYDMGFRAIEDNGMSGRPVAEQEKIGNALAKLGMSMGVFVLDKGGNGANTLADGNQ
jgi:hydroxypyruvate isomerase